MSETLWEPSEARIKDTKISAFMPTNGPFETYDVLWQLSVSEHSDFWTAGWCDCEMAVTQAVNGLNIATTCAMRNPESGNFFKRLDVGR